MDLDVIKKMYVILSEDGNFIKLSVCPQRDTKRMTTGIVVLEENEARRLSTMIQDHLEGRPNQAVEIKDIRKMQRVNQEFRVRTEIPVSPVSAETLQQENLKAEGRLEPQTIGDIAEIKRKETKG
jgi:hypothetical protein